MKPIVEIKDLAIGFPEGGITSPAVKGISFDIREGEILGVVGESGSGKSMSALALMGLLPKDAVVTGGQILFKGTDLLTMKDEEKRKLQGSRMAMVFQEPMTSLNPVMKIEKQVGESLRLHTALSDKEIHRKVVEALGEVGLTDAENLCGKYPHELSGGMRQRVMLAQATVCSPDLIIADEPTTALDVIVQAQILRLLKKIHNENHTSILFISHDLNVVKEICDRVVVVYKGEVVEEGVTKEVLRNPKHEYTKRLVSSIPEGHSWEEDDREILRLENLNVYYDTRGEGLLRKKGKKHVIHDVNMTAYDGEILGIVGESGCGKSTLCKTILGLHDNYTGTVRLEDNLRPQMVFQDPFSSLNPARKIGWILEEPLKLRGITDKDKRRRMVADMLTDVGLGPSFADRRPRELSGGQRQRISIGTALMMDSRLIIADEPVSALDVTVQSQILKLILRLHEEKKMTILFITHDLNIVRRICRRVVVLYRGEIVESGLAGEVYRTPAHPYTELLLASIVDGDPETQEKAVADIGEGVPAGFTGCSFYPRCPGRCERCRTEKPGDTRLGETHTARCFRLQGCGQ